MIAPRLPSVPLGDFPSRRWDQLRRDAADFLASPWAMEAARLGWTDLDLFGVDADRPYTRVDGLSLLPLTVARSSCSAPRERPSKRLPACGRAIAAKSIGQGGCWCGSWAREPRQPRRNEQVRYCNRCRATQPRKTVQVPCTPTNPAAMTKVVSRSRVISLGRLATSICAVKGLRTDSAGASGCVDVTTWREPRAGK